MSSVSNDLKQFSALRSVHIIDRYAVTSIRQSVVRVLDDKAAAVYVRNVNS